MHSIFEQKFAEMQTALGEQMQSMLGEQIDKLDSKLHEALDKKAADSQVGDRCAAGNGTFASAMLTIRLVLS